VDFEGGMRITLRESIPDRVLFLYDANGAELYRVDAADAVPDTTIEFEKPLKVSAIQILAAGEVYA
jgi:hypothetical protein